MCYSIAFLERRISNLAERYKAILAPGWNQHLTGNQLTEDLPAYYFLSGFTHPALPLVTHRGMQLFDWGLIPHWTNDRDAAGKIRKRTLNAVGETVFDKPSYRKPARTQRGLLPVSGFFEWRESGGKKYPYYIYPADRSVFSLGVIYDYWYDRETGEQRSTFSIITTPANTLLATIHNRKQRMPLILPSSAWGAWINPGTSHDAIRHAMRPAETREMAAHTVSRALNHPANHKNTPSAHEEVTYPDLPPLAREQ